MIPNGEGWYYLAGKKLSAFLTVIILKYVVDFYFLNCLRSFKTKSKVESQKKVCEIKFLWCYNAF